VRQRFQRIIAGSLLFANPSQTGIFFQTASEFSVSGGSEILRAQKKMKKVFFEV
jgi:hypothetical protein